MKNLFRIACVLSSLSALTALADTQSFEAAHTEFENSAEEVISDYQGLTVVVCFAVDSHGGMYQGNGVNSWIARNQALSQCEWYSQYKGCFITACTG